MNYKQLKATSSKTLLWSRSDLFLKGEGFTMIELVVAIAVFSLAIGLVAGVFIQALRAQRMANSLMGLNSNASLILEQMAREIRVGFDFNLSNNTVMNGCASDNLISRYNSIDFVRFRGNGTTTVSYLWNSLNKSIDRKEGGGAYSSLTSQNIEVMSLCFVETEHSLNNNSPWRVAIFMTLRSKETQTSKNILNLQTVVSARVLPYETQGP